MLVNLVPEFLALRTSRDPQQAYLDYLYRHHPVLSAYWRNYVLDLDSPHVPEIVDRVVTADYTDLHRLLERTSIERLARDVTDRCEDLFEVDRETDVYLMVGVGAANAGELVVGGRGIAFICLEHFTARANPSTHGLGLDPETIGLWIAHELAHTVRYTSPRSHSLMSRIVHEAGGFYDYWDSGSRATLAELLVNEGLAVAASRAAAPGLDISDYLGYGRRQYRRLRELEAFLRRAIQPELGQRALGYRLRYLSGGMSSAARMIDGRVVPERAGYYIGLRMVEAAVSALGVAGALRSRAEDIIAADELASGALTA